MSHKYFLLSFSVALIFCGGNVLGGPPALDRVLVLQSGPEVGVISVAVSPDGSLVATDSFDGRVRIQDVRTGALLRAIDAGGGRGVAFAPDGRSLAAAGYHMDKLVGIYDVQTGKRLRNLAGHTEWETYAIAFSPDGKLLASAGTDKQILVWDLSSGTLRYRIADQAYPAVALAFSPDSQTLAGGGGDKVVRLWDANSGRLQKSLSRHSDWITTLAFSADGKLIASGSCDWAYHHGRDTSHFAGRDPGCDSQWKLWDAATGELKRTVTAPGRLLSLAIAPDAKSLVCGIGKDVRLYDLQSESPDRVVTTHDAAVTSVAFLRDGRAVLSTSHDHTVKRTDIASDKVEWQLFGYWEQVNSVALSQDATLLATGSSDSRFASRFLPVRAKGIGPGAVRLWDFRSGRLLRRLGDPTEQVMAVALSSDGRRVISGSTNPSGSTFVRAWDTTTGTSIWSQSDHSQEVLSIAFSRDGATLATASADGLVKLRNPASGAVLQTLEGHEGGATSVVFSSDGALIACGAGHGATRLWDARSGKLLRTCPAIGSAKAVTTDRLFNCVAFSPNGKTLAACTVTAGNTYGEPIRFWDTHSGELQRQVIDQKHHGRPIALSPDGSILASGGKTVKLFDVRTGKELRQLGGLLKKTQSIIFSADGRLLISGGSYGTTNVWEVASGRHLVTLFTFSDIHSGAITEDWLAYSPEGFYDGSPGVDRYLAWRVGDDLQMASSVAQQFHRPERIESALKLELPNPVTGQNAAQR